MEATMNEKTTKNITPTKGFGRKLKSFIAGIFHAVKVLATSTIIFGTAGMVLYYCWLLMQPTVPWYHFW